MKKHLFNRLLSLVLAAVMVLGMIPAATAAPAGLNWEKSDVEVSLDKTDRLVHDELLDQTKHNPADVVRVSIVLEDAPTVKAGYATMDIGSNAEALAYDRNLHKVQKTMEKTISVQALAGRKLDVVWNLTLVSNIISANVPYGSIESIKAVKGVKDVVIERQYELDEAEKNSYTSAGMIGSTSVWQTGLTGAGTRIAIIDTGTDLDHQSFDNGAYLYALEQNAAEKNTDFDAYVDSLNLLSLSEIEGILGSLNAFERIKEEDASKYYLGEKLPFAANYVDKNLVVDHDHDEQGSHGSHVAGIAAANRFIPKGNGYVDARDEVRMNGVAPDAQIITLKVFGNAAGPYDSDYFAALEDAIWLGCDSVNLSLGSGAPGTSESYLFEDLLDFLATTDTVAVMSAGNSGHWAEQTTSGYLYSDGVSLQTDGSPGSFTNSLAVASVNNDGTVGKGIIVAGNLIVYAETEYSNRPMTTLDTSADGSGTEYEYIFIDGFGKTEDYAGLDLTGKMVFCSRGGISFFEKGNNAAALGAAATVVYNNDTGVINMDLTDYAYTAPCVSILQADGAAVKAASTQQITADGLVYYTGTVTVSGKLGASEYNSDYYTMSSFSSWGVPGSLELKPEITAPGGLIWSVDGVDTSGSAYEIMSGTSMAAPQVSGMAALVAQYIKENGLDEKTGMSVRHLTQSLLMSTAVPMREEAAEGEYYSIMNQGAGLARVDLAIASESYIEVEDNHDGKVKVELYDDPERVGEYTFWFTIHNMTDDAITYQLDADLFTQSIFDGGKGVMYMDTWTMSLPVEVDFLMEGVSLENIGYECDLNGDGRTNTADADYLLEYLVGNEEKLYANGDVNGDGMIDTYDAHVLLTKQLGTFTVDLAGNDSAYIQVDLKLPENVKAFLDAYYPTGAYIESFVYAEPVSNEEGVAGVTHSIPVLGYYGSWSEPSMYDVGTALEYMYGMENRAPYLYKENGLANNYISYNDGTGKYIFGGNPFVEEAAYMPERNAFNNKNGAYLDSLGFTLIRNAANSMLLIEDADSGEVLLAEEMGDIAGAYYYVNGEEWKNTKRSISLGLGLQGIPEGTRLNISLVTAPELYCRYDPEEKITYTAWEALSEGAYLTNTLTIDNTAPELLDVKMGENNILNVTVKDNEYTAAVALANASGSAILSSTAVNQTERSAAQTVSMDVSEIFGSEFLIAVYDYAENVNVYQITLDLGNERPYFTAVDATNFQDADALTYIGLNADGTSVNLASTDGHGKPLVAAYVEGYVVEINSDHELHVASDADLNTFTYVANLDPNGDLGITGFCGLAYNQADGKIYGLFNSKANEFVAPYLCTINPYVGTMEVLGEMPIDAENLAIDGEGNFYSTIFRAGTLHTYKSDICTTKESTPVGDTGYVSIDAHSMAWDHNTDELYWAFIGYDTQKTTLLKVDTKTAKTEVVSEYDMYAMGLYIAHEPESDPFAPVDEVVSIRVEETADTMKGCTVQLNAEILPWNVSDKSIIWTSSDESVATVDEDGLVYGVGGGTAVITAASVLDPTKTASCTVTISTLNKDLKGLVWEEEGYVWWSEFNTDTLPEYTKLANTTEENLPVNATMVANGTLYASTLDTSSGTSTLYAVDASTFAMTEIGGASDVAYTDIAYGPGTGFGFATYFNYILLVDLETGDYLGGWDKWGEGVAADLVGITYYGSQYNSYYKAYMDIFLILDTNGNVFMDAFIDTGDGFGYFYGAKQGFIQTIGDAVDTPYFQGFYYDGAYAYWTRFNEADDIVELLAWDCEGTGNTYTMGYFPAGVWPVGGLYSDAEFVVSNALVSEELANAKIQPAELMTSIPAVERTALKSDHILNTDKVVKPDSSSSIDDLFGMITVAVTMPQDATNGTFAMSYSEKDMTYLGVTSPADAVAVTVDLEEATISIAYADKNAIPAGEPVAYLHFRGENHFADTTQVTIYTGELNDGTLENVETVDVALPSNCPSEHFVDVNDGDWWHEAVDYVVQAGYMNGMDATHYGPALTMNRAQFVTVLYRMEGEPEVENTGIFTDVIDDQFYTEAAYWALETGITTGTGDGTTFNPGGELTRTELVTFMYRYAKYKEFSTSTDADLSGYRDADKILPFAVDAWKWAVSNGIITGMTSDTLAPMNLTNRAQTAVIFQRFDTEFLWPI